MQLPSKQVGQAGRHADAGRRGHVGRDGLEVFPQERQAQPGHLLQDAQEAGSPLQLREVAAGVRAGPGREVAGVQPQEGQAVQEDGEGDVRRRELAAEQPLLLPRRLCSGEDKRERT